MKKFIVSITLLSLLSDSLAQPTTHPNLFYNNGDLVHVQSGALLHIQGDLENKDGGGANTITNNGVIEVEGNINNEAGATFQRTSGEGVVRMVGGSAVSGVANADHEQRILGDWKTNGKFYNLVIDKENSGSKVVLTDDIEITGSLVWNGSNNANTYTSGTAYNNIRGASRTGNGIIQLFDGGNDYDLYVSNGNSDAIAGHQIFTEHGAASATSDKFILVSGAAPIAVKGFSRSVTQTGADYDYPIATDLNSYNGIRFNFDAVGAGANKITGTFRDGSEGTINQSCVGCHNGIHPAPPDNTGFNYFFNNVTNTGCSGGSGYQWVIFDSLPTTHGIWSFNGNNSNVYEVTAYSSSNDLPIGSENARLIKLSSAYTASNASLNVDWGASILSSVSSTNDLLNYSTNLCYAGDGWRGGTYTGFSHFQTTAASSHSNALPVKLLYLKAEPIENSYIKVSWQTALEIDNKGFEVMRSEDGINFKVIGWVNGNGNATQPIAYSFDDKDVSANKDYYYRLNQIDFSGLSEKSNIVSAKIIDGEQLSISDFMPNPTISGTKLIVTSSFNLPVKVKFYSLLGQELVSQEYQLKTGANDIVFDLTEFADATYSAVIIAANQIYSRKLVIVKN
jgi:hypothetical protein